MGTWKAQDRTVCIRGTVVCGQAEDDAECGIIVDAHNADIDALTAERDAAIDEKLFWVDKYAYEMEKSDRRCDQWERCFRLAFGLKNKYHSNMCALAAERDELQRRLDAILAVPEPEPPCPCKPFRWKQCTCGAYRRGDTSMGQIDGYADTMDLHQKFVVIAEGRTE